jgi:Uma2 family endonuclease
VLVVRITGVKRPRFPFELRDLLLAVEVASPGNPHYDYQTKRVLYLEGGVPEYWIVSPDARTFVRWTHVGDPGEILNDRISWQPDGMANPFVMDLPEFFAEALG